ncbi:hypothetical protein QBC47DRAFT_21443 [Echria macrotheca]|uniref:Zn(2)-C6 fungal-type domain-containing protein n=1 Tax=Echria macrotheca TaxID=438768 RepID=A0AAJ0BSA9_9PEZI|nr:hypothetical protein QBC47DRAFT_21443 [Echria macrotheca]
MTPLEDKMDKPYHAKRPHRKSRTGCRNCKTRKVKCDEARPSCRNCTLRREQCLYPLNPSSLPPASSRSSSSSSPSVTSAVKAIIGTTPVTDFEDVILTDAPSLPDTMDIVTTTPVIREPIFIPAERSELDMRLLWHYTNSTYTSLSSWSKDDPQIVNLLRVKLLEHALTTPFLMDGLLGISAMHLRYLGDTATAPDAVTAFYRARAVEGYRAAIDSADPSTFPALLVSSIILCGLSSSMLRGDEAQPLYILDWISVWRGIRLIIQLTRTRETAPNVMDPLFYRPPCDLEQAAQYIPSNLLFMVASIKPGDEDHNFVEAYYTALKYLGTLYQELSEHGLGPVLDLRIITFFTHLPDEFIDQAKARRKRPVVIIAHYLVFLKMLKTVWWMRGISDSEIVNICNFVGEGWEDLMRVPKAALKLTEIKELARLLLNNHEWEPSVEGGQRLQKLIEMGVLHKREEDDMPKEGLQGFVYQRPELIKR